MAGIASVGRDDKGRVYTRARPLLDKVNLIAGKGAITMDNRRAGVFLQPAESHLLRSVSVTGDSFEGRSHWVAKNKELSIRWQCIDVSSSSWTPFPI